MNLKKMNNSKLNKEKENFELISNEWWVENSKFSILHKINPLRIKYIIEQIMNNKKTKTKNIVNSKIIDIGCGGGLICEPLARLGALVSGVDFVKKNILVAKKHALKENLNINYICCEIEKLSFNKKYDVILLLEVLEHINDWKGTINKVKKFLKKDGIIIFSTINRNILSGILTIFFAEKILKWIPDNTHTYKKFIKPQELVNELKLNKFKILDLKGIVYNPISREWKLSKNKLKINYFCTAKKIN